MSRLIDAMRTEDVRTENGMVTNSTTLNSNVDLFFAIGAKRGQNSGDVINKFIKAYNEDALTAMKILFWVRDVRGGAGERQIFRDIANYLADNYRESMKKNLALIPTYGRWDDLLAFVGTRLEKDALDVIAEGLKSGNALCAKWMPRPNVKNSEKKEWVKALLRHLDMKAGDYRRMLSTISKTVEQLMCSGRWVEIKYAHVPSKAMSDYMKAFGRHDHAGFTAYLDSLEKGEVKINTGAVYPYDVIKNMRMGDSRGADAMWENLPNLLEGSEERLLPIVDVSDSMTWFKVGKNLDPRDVAISLGLYVAGRNVGPFKDAFITFSDRPNLQVVSGKLSERYRQVMRMPWGGSTNLQGVFREILDKAKKHNVPESEMPTMVLIFSDMEFNRGTSGYDTTAQKMIEKMYAEAGYKVPKVAYWNIQSRNDNNPVQFNKKGTALVSGFSPSILSKLVQGKEITPYTMMMDVISSERYDAIRV